MKKSIVFAALISTVSIMAQNAIKYPVTNKGNVQDTYFGTVVNDPYRWLEDDRSTETENWVKAQNEVTYNYLDQIPYRQDLKDRLTKLFNYEKISAPFAKSINFIQKR
jgi:prolyl oligopeptidase